MDNEIKYYKIKIKNIFDMNSKEIIIFVAYENGEYYELLTEDKIYLIENKEIPQDVLIDDFLNKDCVAFGISKEECSEGTISKYLSFIVPSNKEEIISHLKNIEFYTFNSIENIVKKNIKSLKKRK